MPYNIIAALCDSSGSMQDMNPIETSQALNKNIKESSTDDTIFLGAKFSDNYKLFADGIPCHNINITPADIYPCGLTALYDGIQNICRDIKNYMTKRQEKPNSIIVIILTDGQENSSVNCTKIMAKDLISECQKDDWRFIFLGANQNAILEGNNLGIRMGACCTFDASPEGCSNVMKSVSGAIQRSQTYDTPDIEFTQEERDQSLYPEETN